MLPFRGIRIPSIDIVVGFKQIQVLEILYREEKCTRKQLDFAIGEKGSERQINTLKKKGLVTIDLSSRKVPKYMLTEIGTLLLDNLDEYTIITGASFINTLQKLSEMQSKQESPKETPLLDLPIPVICFKDHSIFQHIVQMFNGEQNPDKCSSCKEALTPLTCGCTKESLCDEHSAMVVV